jgi:hypothetical protein
VFAAADLVFLICIGALSAVLMQAAHWPMWNFWLCAAIGMVFAMTAQTLLALLVAPVLGSIEAMIPSMLVAMGSPMVVCTLHLSGREPGSPSISPSLPMAPGCDIVLRPNRRRGSSCNELHLGSTCALVRLL